MRRRTTIRSLAAVLGTAPGILVNVHARSLILETAPGLDVTGDGEPASTLEREGGRPLLLRIPGG